MHYIVQTQSLPTQNYLSLFKLLEDLIHHPIFIKLRQFYTFHVMEFNCWINIKDFRFTKKKNNNIKLFLLTWATRRLSHVKEDRLTLPGQMRSPHVFGKVCIAQTLLLFYVVFYVLFCGYLSFYFFRQGIVNLFSTYELAWRCSSCIFYLFMFHLVNMLNWSISVKFKINCVAQTLLRLSSLWRILYSMNTGIFLLWVLWVSSNALLIIWQKKLRCIRYISINDEKKTLWFEY